MALYYAYSCVCIGGGNDDDDDHHHQGGACAKYKKRKNTKKFLDRGVYCGAAVFYLFIFFFPRATNGRALTRQFFFFFPVHIMLLGGLLGGVARGGNLGSLSLALRRNLGELLSRLRRGDGLGLDLGVNLRVPILAHSLEHGDLRRATVKIKHGGFRLGGADAPLRGVGGRARDGWLGLLRARVSHLGASLDARTSIHSLVRVFPLKETLRGV